MFKSRIGVMVFAANLLTGISASTAVMVEEPPAPREAKKIQPNYEVKFVPVQPPKGADAYPAGTTIKGDELRFPPDTKEPVTAYFEIRIEIRSGESSGSNTAVASANEPLRGHCCTEIETPLGWTSNCENVYTAAQQTACEEGGNSGFTPGSTCLANPCASNVDSFLVPIRVVPEPECSPVRFRRLAGRCKLNGPHPGGTPHAGGHEGVSYEGTGYAGGIDESDCLGAMEFGGGVIADCLVAIIGPDADGTRILDSKGRRLAVETKGLKIVFGTPPDPEKK